jgi:hypothetical protein
VRDVGGIDARALTGQGASGMFLIENDPARRPLSGRERRLLRRDGHPVAAGPSRAC